MADNYIQEMEALFTRFIYIGDASEGVGNHRLLAASLRGEPPKWGWLVHENAGDLYMGYQPDFGYSFQGVHETQRQAMDAACAYIWKMRGDLVAQCKRELSKIRSYATSRAAGNSGMHVA